MKADWKNNPLRQYTKRTNDLQRLQQRVAELEDIVIGAKKSAQFYRERAASAGEQLKQATQDKTLFNALLQEEVMVPTKDGFKLLTGNELREYCVDLSITKLSIRQNEQLAASAKNLFNQVYLNTFLVNVNTRSQT